MRLSTTSYTKQFTSQKIEGMHEKKGCFFQKQGEEDNEIRIEINKKFGLGNRLGFDGKMLYRFEIKDNLNIRRESSPRRIYHKDLYPSCRKSFF